MRLPASTLLAVLLSTASASAQSDAERARPPVELGVGIDRIWTYSYDDEVGLEGFDAAAVSLRLTVPFSAMYAIEGIVSVQHRPTRLGEITETMYAVQVKRRLRAPGKAVHGFATFGAAGGAYRERRPQRVVLRLDETDLVVPASVDAAVLPPVGALLGGGVQYAFARRAALRVDAQVAMLLYLPVAVRVSASLTIPFGRYRQLV